MAAEEVHRVDLDRGRAIDRGLTLDIGQAVDQDIVLDIGHHEEKVPL